MFMKAFYTCLVVTVLLCLHVATAAQPSKWRETLRESTNRFTKIPVGTLSTYYFSVPSAAAEILQNRPSGELFPFLNALREEGPSWRAGVVDLWILVVRDKLRGHPRIQKSSGWTDSIELQVDQSAIVYDYIVKIKRHKPEEDAKTDR
jgi:hypothetical protein